MVLVLVVIAVAVIAFLLLRGDSGLKVTDTIQVGASPAAVTIGGGSVWVANNAGGTLVRVDPDSKKVASRPVLVGESPEYAAFGEGSVWVTSGLGSRVVRVNASTGRLEKTLIPGIEPSGIAVGAGAAWVADTVEGTVRRFDARTNKQVGRPIKVGAGPEGVAFGAGAVWVANFGEHTVSRIDPNSNKVVARISVGHGPADVAVGEGGVWVTNVSDQTLSKIDPATNQSGEQIKLGGAPGGLGVGQGLCVGRRRQRQQPPAGRPRRHEGEGLDRRRCPSVRRRRRGRRGLGDMRRIEHRRPSRALGAVHDRPSGSRRAPAARGSGDGGGDRAGRAVQARPCRPIAAARRPTTTARWCARSSVSSCRCSAARSILARMYERFDGRTPTPQQIWPTIPRSCAPPPACRVPRSRFLRDLAEHVDSGALVLEELDDLSDKEVGERLVRGEGASASGPSTCS